MGHIEMAPDGPTDQFKRNYRGRFWRRTFTKNQTELREELVFFLRAEATSEVERGAVSLPAVAVWIKAAYDNARETLKAGTYDFARLEAYESPILYNADETPSGGIAQRTPVAPLYRFSNGDALMHPRRIAALALWDTAGRPPQAVPPMGYIPSIPAHPYGLWKVARHVEEPEHERQAFEVIDAIYERMQSGEPKHAAQRRRLSNSARTLNGKDRRRQLPRAESVLPNALAEDVAHACNVSAARVRRVYREAQMELPPPLAYVLR